jgi:hypothetical protein
MGINIDKMKQKLAAAQGKGEKKSDFWRPQEGENVIRILPSPDEDPFKEHHFHYNLGNRSGFLCPKRNFGDDCPVCSFATKLFNEGSPESVQQAKSLFARQRFFSPVLVRGQESEGVKVWGYGKTVYETLLSLVLNPDYGDITDPEDGTDLVLSYGKAPGMLYPQTKVQPRRKSSKLCEDGDEACQEIVASVPDLDTLFERKSTQDVQGILNEFLNEGVDAETESSETTKYASPTTEASNDVESALKELGM